MLRGQYCWDCKSETNRTVQATNYINLGRWMGRKPVCKMHKKIAGNAYLRIQRAMWLRERLVLKHIRSANKKGNGWENGPLSSFKTSNAVRRLVKKGIIVWSCKGGRFYYAKESGYWLTEQLPAKMRRFVRKGI